MKTSCIKHPENNRFLIIRDWQLKFCENNSCAAALLSIFEYFHNVRLNDFKKQAKWNTVSEQHGDRGGFDISLLQYHTLESLQESLLRTKGHSSIQAGLALLIKKNVITQHKNPNPRYTFDNTPYYLFHHGVINRWIDRCYANSIDYMIDSNLSIHSKSTDRSDKLNLSISSQVTDRKDENNRWSVDFNCSSAENNTTLNKITLQENKTKQATIKRRDIITDVSHAKHAAANILLTSADLKISNPLTNPQLMYIWYMVEHELHKHQGNISKDKLMDDIGECVLGVNKE